jgi:GT2 family glycosyltransferase
MPVTKKGQGRLSLAFLLRAWRRRQYTEAAIDRAYRGWARRDRPDAAAWQARLRSLKAAGTISIVMPVHDPEPAWLQAAIDSVRAQYYDKWELLITDDASQSPAIASILAQAAADHRIDIVRLPRSAGISAATNAALARASGDYVTFLDHDDELAPHALAAVACEIAATPSLDLVFSDEDHIVNNRRAAPYFKPGWNPDLLLAQNVVGHLAVYRRALVATAGMLRPAYDGSQDHDFALRAVADIDERRVRHIPQILYHWRQSPGSASAATAEKCRDAAMRAAEDHLGRRAAVTADAVLPQWPRVRFALPNPAPTVSIVGTAPISSYEKTLIETVAEAAWASSDVLVFVAPNLRPLQPDWLAELVAHASRPEIGAAGARLTAPDGTLLHAGYILDPAAIAHSPTADADDPGYRGQYRLLRSVAAVSADCLAIRRTVFEAAGGFTAAAGDYKGVDLCLKLAARGLRTVWSPYAELQYTVPPSPPLTGANWMRSRWARALAADAYANPNLRLARGRVSLDKRRPGALPLDPAGA